MSGVFEDSKVFVDMPMKAEPDVIISAYYNLTDTMTPESLLTFVQTWFDPVGSDLLPWEPPDWQERPPFIDRISHTPHQEWALALNRLWKAFGKQVKSDVAVYQSRHSLLHVPNPFIAPGGRFNEFYYWDSYWIIKGLLLCGMNDTSRGMINNLIYLVNRYGFVPNGGRIYYTRRSQPPLLTWMVHLYYEFTADLSFVREVLPALDQEYQYWMANHTVYVSQCECNANRYISLVNRPRPESYKEDVTLSENVLSNDTEELYSNIASGAESGWDFSSRWLSEPNDLSSIQTRNVIPVDLNAILGINELFLHKLHILNGSDVTAGDYARAFERRQVLFDELFWNESDQLYEDWLLEEELNLPGYYASTTVPLYMYMLNNSSNVTRDKIMLNKLKDLGVLSYPGGLPTSLIDSKQQWDYPNAWAPLQWFIVKSWEHHEDSDLRGAAESVMKTWLNTTVTGWITYNHSMFEKYNCTELGRPGAGGEYIVQAGFGWTNGITLDFLNSLYSENPPSPVVDSFHYLWFLAIVPFLVILVIFICCICVCRRIYVRGKKTYWARVRNEQLIHSTTTTSTNNSVTQSPMIFVNQNTIDNMEDENDRLYVN
jgi:alpha,alpha-trehalase